MSEIKVTKDNFGVEVMGSSIPVVVDFWAEWCGPCKMISPTLSTLAKEYEGKIKVAKIDTDVEFELAQRFNVMSIPMVLIFKQGKVVKQTIGAGPRSLYEKMIKDVLEK